MSNSIDYNPVQVIEFAIKYIAKAEELMEMHKNFKTVLEEVAEITGAASFNRDAGVYDENIKKLTDVFETLIELFRQIKKEAEALQEATC